MNISSPESSVSTKSIFTKISSALLVEEDSLTDNTISTESLAEQLTILRSDIFHKIDQQKVELISYLQNENLWLKADILELSEKVKEKDSALTTMEKKIANLQQYVRRNNLEFCGIPNEISDQHLEKKVIDLAGTIGVKIEGKDIETCHRLNTTKNESTKRTIVRFVNRKHCERLHKNKSKLYEKKEKLREIGIKQTIYINNNLCPLYKSLWGKSKKLNEFLIDRFWVYNGMVHIAINENSKALKIDHLATLKEQFPGYDFESK